MPRRRPTSSPLDLWPRGCAAALVGCGCLGALALSALALAALAFLVVALAR